MGAEGVFRPYLHVISTGGSWPAGSPSARPELTRQRVIYKTGEPKPPVRRKPLSMTISTIPMCRLISWIRGDLVARTTFVLNNFYLHTNIVSSLSRVTMVII